MIAHRDLFTYGLTVVALLPVFGCTRAADSSDEAPSDSVTDAPPPTIGRPSISTDRETYALRRTPDALATEIVATFTNYTTHPLYLHPCGRRGGGPIFSLQKWSGSAWMQAYAVICPAILMVDVPFLVPRASTTDTLRVQGSLRPSTRPRFEVDSVPGWYRIVYGGVYRGQDADGSLRDPLPEEQRVSGPFRITG